MMMLSIWLPHEDPRSKNNWKKENPEIVSEITDQHQSQTIAMLAGEAPHKRLHREQPQSATTKQFNGGENGRSYDKIDRLFHDTDNQLITLHFPPLK